MVPHYANYAKTLICILRRHLVSCVMFSVYWQTRSVIFMFSSINQAKTHKYEFEHFIYENKQGFDGINLN